MNKEEIIAKIEELKKKKAKAEFDANLQDVFQHSFKILLNSVYGFAGTKFSPVFNRDIAESVTLTGQKVIKEMVKFTNKCLNKIGKDGREEEWVVAGDTDSVIGSSKIPLDSRYIEISKAFELLKDRVDILENGTEIAIPNKNHSTSSLNGKTIVKNISRHKVRKQMFSIEVPGHEPLTLTEDHSVMIQRGDKVIECRPSEIKDTDYFIVE